MWENIVTARIRRMTEGNIFSLSTLVGGWGGLPHLRSGWGGGGTQSQVQTGGPHLRSGLGGGVSHHRSRWGRLPHPRSERGVPHSADGGYPIQDQDGGTLEYPLPIQDWMGYPPDLRWGYPPSKTGWGTPHQQNGVPPPPSKTGWGTPAPRQQNGVTPPSPVSKASTWYAAGGVSLAFTQEDFLV